MLRSVVNSVRPIFPSGTKALEVFTHPLYFWTFSFHIFLLFFLCHNLICLAGLFHQGTEVENYSIIFYSSSSEVQNRHLIYLIMLWSFSIFWKVTTDFFLSYIGYHKNNHDVKIKTYINIYPPIASHSSIFIFVSYSLKVKKFKMQVGHIFKNKGN